MSILNRIAAIKRLIERPGTPGEKAAAEAALERLQKNDVQDSERLEPSLFNVKTVTRVYMGKMTSHGVEPVCVYEFTDCTRAEAINRANILAQQFHRFTRLHVMMTTVSQL